MAVRLRSRQGEEGRGRERCEGGEIGRDIGVRKIPGESDACDAEEGEKNSALDGLF